MTDRQALAHESKVILGDAFAEQVRLSLVAMASFDSAELRSFLDETGLGNHHLLISAFAHFGKIIEGNAS